MSNEATALESRRTQVPDLVRTPALEIGAEDVALPRVKIGQYMSDQVQENSVPVGSIYTTLGSEDPEPSVLAKYDKDDMDGVLIHILGMTRGKSITIDGNLETFGYNDPDAPEGAWVTYDYVVALPEVDDGMPYKWLFTRTGKPAAQQINMILARNAGSKPVHELAFEITTAFRENSKGKWYVPKARHVEAAPRDIEIAASLATMLDGTSVDAPSQAGDEPAI